MWGIGLQDGCHYHGKSKHCNPSILHQGLRLLRVRSLRAFFFSAMETIHFACAHDVVLQFHYSTVYFAYLWPIQAQEQSFSGYP